MATGNAIGAGLALGLLALRYGLSLPVLEADTSSFDAAPRAVTDCLQSADM